MSRSSLAAFHDLLPAAESFRDAVWHGFSRPKKSIPCRFLYDARGSMLFEQICDLPEYYLTRTELGILEEHAAAMAERIGPAARLIEFGSGSSRKVRVLLEALKDPAAYIPVDISREYLRLAAESLAADFPRLDVAAVCADYREEFALPDTPRSRDGRAVVFFPGSTIGNFEPGEA
jgi:uncharacterized SAM-dependent methyltransferase